jgi:hypothetical protein
MVSVFSLRFKTNPDYPLFAPHNQEEAFIARTGSQFFQCPLYALTQ